MNKFNAAVEIDGKRYGLPSIEELTAIFPAGQYLKNSTVVPTVTEAVRFPWDTQARSLSSSYQSVNNVPYGIRFKDDTNKFLTAYR